MYCKQCGFSLEEANFCPQCGEKTSITCDCWVLHKKYNCDFLKKKYNISEKCPAYRLNALIAKEK